jgi:putative transposase
VSSRSPRQAITPGAAGLASLRAAQDIDLTRKIRTIHGASHKTYGEPRIHAELKAEGVAIGQKRVARLMRAAGLVGASRRRSVTTTKRDPDHRPAHDLVRRNFFVEKPNELWVADITFVPTLAGFLFLAVVLDAWSRRIVGWAFSADLKTRVVLDALDMALAVRKPENVIHHSDQGSQYTSLAVGNRCKDAGVRPSTGSVATPTTTPCARASSRRWNASCSIDTVSAPTTRRGWPSSTSSKASTIRHAAIRRWDTSRPSNTKGSIMN